jgi:hypothetical protein
MAGRHPSKSEIKKIIMPLAFLLTIMPQRKITCSSYWKNFTDLELEKYLVDSGTKILVTVLGSFIVRTATIQWNTKETTVCTVLHCVSSLFRYGQIMQDFKIYKYIKVHPVLSRLNVSP